MRAPGTTDVLTLILNIDFLDLHKTKKNVLRQL